jgi:hypothetical protein
MRIPRRAFTLLTALCLGASVYAADSAPSKTADDSPWPEITRENKPWTRWWWPGSAVDKASLTRQLEQFAAAGLGGVEITPIYGARGYESRYIPYLSKEWMDMLEHVGREAKRLGLGVDMATGTGWPFGGPWIDESNSLKKIAFKDGQLTGQPTQMKVKRAAPGGEGLVIDPFSTDAVNAYLAPFSKAFSGFPQGLVRGQFHDSFEYYDASWTPKFAAVFKEMHGYDIQEHAAELMGQKKVDPDTLARLKSDYRDTLARLHLDYLHSWVQWSHQRGFVVRNQSHGAPGNLLDLYANADIAETEVFGSTPFPIPGLRRNADEVRHDQDLPETLVIRFASSAGHVAGHNLTSSETCTWLRDHWKVALAYAKPEIDRLFADGINHIFYHGTVFSAQDVPWPGWLFYASTQFNPNNTWWDDFGALNRYVARVQSVLQRGTPDNDILLYWPVEDIWDSAPGLMKQLTVHDVKWITEQPVGKTARALLDRGYSFDYISDAQLQQLKADGRQLVSNGTRYKILVIPTTRRMPLETFRRIVALARENVAIYFISMPEDVPGLGRLEQRRAEFKTLREQVSALTKDKRYAVYGAQTSASEILPTAGILDTFHVAREPIAEKGMQVIRRATKNGHDYFFANLTAEPLDGWVTLGTGFGSATLLDPLTGAFGAAAVRAGDAGKGQVYLQLAPGASLLLRATTATASVSQAWQYTEPAGQPVALQGTWSIEFVKGGPVLPPALQTTELKSWTDLGGDEAQRFGGTARYRLEFDAPAAKADDWLLNLGEVRESARVRINGQEVTTAWSLPFVVRVGRYLKPGRNVIELDVTNLAANRIRDLDRRGVDWKIMREINFVNINYQPFDASKWPLTPSGLLGPVTLTPLRFSLR